MHIQSHKHEIAYISQPCLYFDVCASPCAAAGGLQVVRQLEVPEGWPTNDDNHIALLVNETVQVGEAQSWVVLVHRRVRQVAAPDSNTLLRTVIVVDLKLSTPRLLFNTVLCLCVVS